MSISLPNNTDCVVYGDVDATLCIWLVIKDAIDRVGQGMYGPWYFRNLG